MQVNQPVKLVGGAPSRRAGREARPSPSQISESARSRAALVLRVMEALRATKEAVEGRGDVHGAVGALLEAKEGRIGAEGAADVMWLLHAEDLARHGDEMEKKERANRRASIVREFLDREGDAREVLLRLLPHRTMQDANLVRDAEDLKTREKRMNTKLQYIQNKANLLAEASEGYAKFLLCLVHAPEGEEGGLRESNWEVERRRLLEIVGRFSLDPNRCAGLLLDAMQAFPDRPFLLYVLRRFRRDGWEEILGTTFQAYASSERTAQVGTNTPHSLYTLAAKLVTESIVTLEGTWSYLSPTEEEMENTYQEDSEQRKKDVRNAGRVSLASIASSSTPGAKSGSAPSTISKKKNRIPGGLNEEGWCSTNQKVGLLQALLEQGNWPSARKLLRVLSKYEVSIYPPISRALLKLIRGHVDSLYSVVSQEEQGGISPDLPFPDLKSFLGEDCCEWLEYCNNSLGMDPVVMAKLSRCIKLYISQGTERDVHGDVLRQSQAFLADFLLPSLSLASPFPSTSKEVWSALGEMPFTTRCKIYTNWKANLGESTWASGAPAMAISEIKKILRRISSDEEVIQKMKPAVAKLVHANPIAVFETIVTQIEFYSNMIDPIVKSLGFVTDLGFDVLTMIVMQRLVMPGREKLKEDGINVADWLQSLAAFCGSVCRTYPGVGLTPILQLLTSSLRKDDNLNLVVLREIISKVGGLDLVEEVSGALISTLSPKVRFFATACEREGAHEDSLRHLQRLGKALMHSSPSGSPLAVPLLVLIAQQTCAVAYHFHGTFLKVVGNMYDICQQAFLQYSEVLGNAIHASAYSQETLPSVEQLLCSFGLAPEVVWHMYRPFMDETKQTLLGQGPLLDRKKSLRGTVLPKGFDLEYLQSKVSLFVPGKSLRNMSKELYMVFWMFNLQDIYVSEYEFNSKIARLKATMEEMRAKSLLKRREQSVPGTGGLNKSLEIMKEEFEKMKKNQSAVLKWLQQQKDTWFSSSSQDTMLEFIQLCILPRARMSPRDALFCSRFVMFLAAFEAQNFSLSTFVEVMVEKLPYVVMASSELEAGRLAVVYNDIFTWLGTLSYSIAKSFNELPEDRKCQMQEDFARQTIQWYTAFAQKLVSFSSSEEYMNIRNTLIILTASVKVFPVLASLSSVLETKIRSFAEDESRQDIKMQANMYLQALKQQHQVMLSEEELMEKLLELQSLDVTDIREQVLRGEFHALQKSREVPVGEPEPTISQEDAPHVDPTVEPEQNGKGMAMEVDKVEEGMEDVGKSKKTNGKSEGGRSDADGVETRDGDMCKESGSRMGDKKMLEPTGTSLQANVAAVSAKTTGNQSKDEKHPAPPERPPAGNKRKVKFTNDERGNSKRQRAPSMADQRDRHRNLSYGRQEDKDSHRGRDQRFSRKRSRSPPPAPRKDAAVLDRQDRSERAEHPSQAGARSQPSAPPPPPRHRQRRGK